MSFLQSNVPVSDYLQESEFLRLAPKQDQPVIASCPTSILDTLLSPTDPFVYPSSWNTNVNVGGLNFKKLYPTQSTSCLVTQMGSYFILPRIGITQTAEQLYYFYVAIPAIIPIKYIYGGDFVEGVPTVSIGHPNEGATTDISIPYDDMPDLTVVPYIVNEQLVMIVCTPQTSFTTVMAKYQDTQYVESLVSDGQRLLYSPSV